MKKIIPKRTPVVEADKEFLILNHKSMTAVELSNKMNRPYSTVIHLLAKLGIEAKVNLRYKGGKKREQSTREDEIFNERSRQNWLI